jgi:AraC-like DNA-binding protein
MGVGAVECLLLGRARADAAKAAPRDPPPGGAGDAWRPEPGAGAARGVGAPAGPVKRAAFEASLAAAVRARPSRRARADDRAAWPSLEVPFRLAERHGDCNDPSVLFPRPSPASEATGTLHPWPAILVTWGPGGVTRLHAHHCWHLIVGLDGDLSVTTRAGGRPSRAGALISAPDTPHAVDAEGTRALIVFVEPESEAGDRLLAGHGRGSVDLFPNSDADRLRAVLSPEGSGLADPEAAVARSLSLGGEPVAPPHGRHPAVRRVLRHLRQASPDADTSLDALARIAGLSPGRFMHAFTEAVGIPLRPYLRWLKLERAGAALATGVSLGEAAYGAGFADAAHMTRTFRRMFGVSPSEVRRRSQSVQDR